MDATSALMPDSAALLNTPTRATALARVFSALRAARPRADREAFLRCGIPAKRPAVRRFPDEPGYAEGLRHRAQGFCREFHAGERRSLRDIAAAAGRAMTAMAAGLQV